MNKIKGAYALITAALAAMLCFSAAVSAEVFTSREFDPAADTVYVAGNEDFYPIEYFDEYAGKFDGVLPRILADLSRETGITFTYIKNGKPQDELAESGQADFISAYITDSKTEYVVEPLTVLACTNDGKTIRIGWGFTEKADRKVINAMRKFTKSISAQEINGYLMLSSNGGRRKDNWVMPLTVIYCIILMVIIVAVTLKIRRADKRLSNNKMTDTETGIGNLLFFEHCFNNIISDISRSIYYVAYITIDSNYLQAYHGECAFKDSVKYTAEVLKASLGENEFTARISENGFAYAYQSTNSKDARTIIEKIMQKLNGYIGEDFTESQPYFHIAVYPLRTDDRNSELLIFNLRKNCSNIMGTDQQLIMCSSTMMNSAAEERRLTESIVRGLKNGEFKLYLQFIADNHTKKFVSAEALSRWDSPELGVVPPAQYIRVMEQSGHIAMLDFYMFEMCCRQLHKWKDTEFDHITISCNFTRITLSEIDFVEKITEIAKRYVFDSRKLIIEITEDTIEKNFECAIENIKRCKALGYRVALDDLGTGYTSLLNLCDYPIDIVKVDRDILLKTDTESGKCLFTGVIALAHSLGLKVVCEGVETEQHRELVENTDCDYVQGWYYSGVFPQREGERFAKEHI